MRPLISDFGLGFLVFFGFRGIGTWVCSKVEARKPERDPSTNHPKSMFQLSGVDYRVLGPLISDFGLGCLVFFFGRFWDLGFGVLGTGLQWSFGFGAASSVFTGTEPKPMAEKAFGGSEVQG